jgi:hypothetical protein
VGVFAAGPGAGAAPFVVVGFLVGVGGLVVFAFEVAAFGFAAEGLDLAAGGGVVVAGFAARVGFAAADSAAGRLAAGTAHHQLAR